VKNISTMITQDLNIDLENIDFQMVSHSYQIHIFNIIVMVNQLMCIDVFMASMR
jgi:hypothetical protein